MLKWLQSGVYHSSNLNSTIPNVQDIITDDPLATLNFKEDSDKDHEHTSRPGILAFKSQIVHKEIYSVSR